MSVWKLYTQLFARNWRCGRFAWSLSQGCSEKIRKKDDVMTAGRWSSWSIQTRSSWCSGDLQWKLNLLLWPRDQETKFLVEACWLSQAQEGQTEQIHQQTFDDPFFWQHWHDQHALDSHWTDSQQGIQCWGFKRVHGEDSIGRGQHQSTTPSLSQTIWPRWASTQFLSLPKVQTLLPVTFAYSLSSRKTLEAIIMRQLRRWKRLWRRSLTCSHKRTSMGAFQKLLEWYNKCIGGDYFKGDLSFMCVLSIKVAIRKKSGNLLCAPCMICVSKKKLIIFPNAWIQILLKWFLFKLLVYV